MHKTVRFVLALYARGRGSHYVDIITINSSSVSLFLEQRTRISSDFILGLEVFFLICVFLTLVLEVDYVFALLKVHDASIFIFWKHSEDQVKCGIMLYFISLLSFLRFKQPSRPEICTP